MHMTTPSWSDNYEFSDYVQFGVKRIPETMSFRRGGDFRVELHVDKLVAAAGFVEGTFAVPNNAIVRDWCINPESSGKASDSPGLPMESSSGSRAPVGYLAAYLRIGTDGHVKEVYPLRSLNSDLERNVLGWLSQMTFAVTACRGKPIEGERFFETERTIVPQGRLGFSEITLWSTSLWLFEHQTISMVH